MADAASVLRHHLRNLKKPLLTPNKGYLDVHEQLSKSKWYEDGESRGNEVDKNHVIECLQVMLFHLHSKHRALVKEILNLLKKTDLCFSVLFSTFI